MKIKKILAVLLAAGMVTGMGVPAMASEEEREMVGNMYTTGYPIVEEPVTYRFLVCADADPNVMKIWNDYAEKTNVKIEWDYYDYSTAVEKKNLMFTSGDYPDMVGGWLLSDDDIVTYGSDVFVPVEEMIEAYAPNITNALDNFPNARGTMTAPDGHIYGFGIMGPQPDCAWISFINKQWLENVNMEMPETLEEFEAVLKAFKEQDANGNGDPNDEIPFSFYNDPYIYGSLFGAFGRLDNENHLVLEDGKVVFTADKEEYKEAVKWLNSLYEQGLIDQEAFTQDVTQYGTKGKSGDVSLYGAFIDFNGINVVNQERYESEYTVLPPLAGEDGTRLWAEGDKWIFRNQLAITTAAENPEVLVRWIDGLYEPEMSYQVCYGPLGTVTEKTEDGMYQYIEIPDGKNEQDLRLSETVSSQPYCIMPEFNEKIVGNATTFIKAEADAQVLPYVTDEPWPNVWKTQEEGQELAIITGDIQKLVNEKRAQWITGQSDIDEDWDVYVESLQKSYHIVNVTDEEVFPLITGILDQYLPLFSSRKVNICCDETFDLGKGKSAGEMEKKGYAALYYSYVNRLAEYLQSKGREVMIWADIVLNHPEEIEGLNKDITCLNWYYYYNEKEENVKIFADHHFKQYVCPSLSGYSRLVNAFDMSFSNIREMASFGAKYGAEGFLNTDWGDCGHINMPALSVPGMIYGAAQSWNPADGRTVEEIDEAISMVEYGDETRSFMKLATDNMSRYKKNCRPD